MTVKEARQNVAAIKGNLACLQFLLANLQQRQGWKALGYKNWDACVEAELGSVRRNKF